MSQVDTGYTLSAMTPLGFTDAVARPATSSSTRNTAKPTSPL
jgi:hypothetical protein